MVKQVSVEDLKAKLDAKEELFFVDVREKDEHEFCRIAGAVLIPLSEFSERGPKEIPKDKPIYIHCHHGGRSNRACEYLESQGFTNTHNIVGGIDAWSLKIDSQVKRY